MCGVVGIIRASGLRDDERGVVLERMRDSIAHRGPDDATSDIVDDWVALGHRRLSIIDLEGSKQPLANEDSSIRCVFNGEIYNFQELRRQLTDLGHTFATHGDGEVIVHGYEQWGEDVCQRLEGMFTFLLVDRKRRCVLAARDRAGIKPLFVAHIPGALLFASELKALLEHPDMPRSANGDALDIGAVRMHVPWPLTAFSAAHRMAPGSVLRVSRSGEERTTRFARVVDYPFDAKPPSVEETQARVEMAVRRQMVADVPVGAFLSGGIDSTLIVAMMTRLTQAPIHTFSIKVDGPYDESAEAQETARRLGVIHHTIPIRAFEPDALHELVGMFDEPYAEVSALGVRALSRAARTEVKVALSGDGGDEVFGGYDTHRWVAWMANLRLGWQGARRPPRVLDAFLQSRRLPTIARRGARFLSATAVRPERAHRMLTNFGWAVQPDSLAKSESLSDAVHRAAGGATWNAARAAMATDRLERLPNAMLTKVDVASMAASLEVRVPMLDDGLVRYADGLPVRSLVGVRRGKLLLRAVLDRLLPGGIAHRPKRGFSLPLDSWLLQAPARVDELVHGYSPHAKRLIGLDAAGLWKELREGQTRMSPGSTAILLFWLLSVGIWAERFRITDADRSGLGAAMVA